MPTCAPARHPRALAPVRERDGLVVEIGCGSGLLTRYLVDAGHRVLATDASPAMLELARATVPDAFVGIEQLTMPDDPVPPTDAVVSIGHPSATCATAEAISTGRCSRWRGDAPRWCARGRPRGPRVGGRARDQPAAGARRRRLGDRLGVFDVPSPDRFVRDMTTFLPRTPTARGVANDERHDNVMVDTWRVPALLASERCRRRSARGFGAETLPVGLRAIVGWRVP